MFTGIVEDIGTVINKVSRGKEYTFTINSPVATSDCKLGDSISVNGVCQTVIAINNTTFTFDTVEETVKKTNLGSLTASSKVNIERAMRADSRFGGHFVLGHVDTVGIVKENSLKGDSYSLIVNFESKYYDFMVETGSITVDGISFTLAELTKSSFRIAVIPHTWKSTILNDKKIGDTVNLEFDVLGKYAAKLLGKASGGNISESWLRENGF